MPVRDNQPHFGAIFADSVYFLHRPEQVLHVLYDVLPVHFFKIIIRKRPGIFIKIVNDIHTFYFFLIKIYVLFFDISSAAQVELSRLLHQITTSGKVSGSFGSNGLSIYIKTKSISSPTFLKPCARPGDILIIFKSSSLSMISFFSPDFMSFSTRCIFPFMTQYHSFIFLW